MAIVFISKVGIATTFTLFSPFFDITRGPLAWYRRFLGETCLGTFIHFMHKDENISFVKAWLLVIFTLVFTVFFACL